MIHRSVAVTGGKGGVLKTSVSVEVAGTAARAGWRTLLIDTDAQGNAETNLGYAARSDAGEGLLEALSAGVEPPVLAEVRPNLDVVCGGSALDELPAFFMGASLKGMDVGCMFEASLGPLAEQYDLVCVDMAPSKSQLHTSVYSAVQSLVIPTQPDQASIDGIAPVLQTYAQVRKGSNPNLTILGVVVTRVTLNATKIRRDVRTQLDELLEGKIPVFNTVIREAAAAAVELRRLGLLSSEYELEAKLAPSYFELLKRGTGKTKHPFAAAISGLASDYQELTEEIIAALAALDVPSEPGAPVVPAWAGE
jgi:cellulose biosynthesis protein BcsQ